MTLSPSRRWMLWLGALAAWTVLLLVPGWWFGQLPQTKLPGEITLGKLLHVAAYGISTATVRLLPASIIVRIGLVIVLSLHAGLTEYLQTWVGRDGRWLDVGIDHVGIGLGLVAMMVMSFRNASTKRR